MLSLVSNFNVRTASSLATFHGALTAGGLHPSRGDRQVSSDGAESVVKVSFQLYRLDFGPVLLVFVQRRQCDCGLHQFFIAQDHVPQAVSVKRSHIAPDR